MRLFDLVAEAIAPGAAQFGDQVEQYKSPQPVGADATPLVQATVNPGCQFWAGLYPRPEAGGQQADDLFTTGMKELGIAKLSECGGDWAGRCQLRSHLERIVVPQTEGVSTCVAV